MRFVEGHPVRVEFTKWGGPSRPAQPHWEYDGVYLGADEFGDWIGHPAGTHLAKPGRAYDSSWAWLTLVPNGPTLATGGSTPWWLGTFNAEGAPLEIYVDMTDEPHWDGDIVRMIDLDLDVVRARDHAPDRQGVYIDDEDEFAEHQVLYGYPDEVIAGAESSCRAVHEAVLARTPPFDGPSAATWLARIPRT